MEEKNRVQVFGVASALVESRKVLLNYFELLFLSIFA